MGVIKKKTVTRGTEGGVKYICDVCSADITNTVSASVASPLALRLSAAHPAKALRIRAHLTKKYLGSHTMCQQCLQRL